MKSESTISPGFRVGSVSGLGLSVPGAHQVADSPLLSARPERVHADIGHDFFVVYAGPHYGGIHRLLYQDGATRLMQHTASGDLVKCLACDCEAAFVGGAE